MSLWVMGVGVLGLLLVGCQPVMPARPLLALQAGPGGMARLRSGLPTTVLVDPATRPWRDRTAQPTDVLVDPATRPSQARSGPPTPYLMSPEVYRPQIETLLSLGSRNAPDEKLYRRLLTLRFSRTRPDAIYFTGIEYTYAKFVGADQKDIYGYYCFGQDRSACGNGGMVFDTHPLE